MSTPQYEAQKGNRFSVFSKFPTWAILAVENFTVFHDKAVDFDLLVVMAPTYQAKADGRTIEALALDWMTKEEKHRVKMVFYDALGVPARTWNMNDVEVERVRLENINSNIDGDAVFRVTCTGTLTDVE